MTRRLRIEWEPGEKVDGLLTGPGEGPVGVVLAHGAGAGQRHPFIAGIRKRLGAAGLPTLSFDYPYVAAGRRAPDRLPRLLLCHAAAVERLQPRVDRLVLAGKSMGGRIGGHLAAEHRGADRLVFYGYPLLPPGRSAPRDVTHLGAAGIPILFAQGERDRLAPLGLLTPVVAAIPLARLEIVPEADHSFRVPKRTGLDAESVLDTLAEWTVDFVGG